MIDLLQVRPDEPRGVRLFSLAADQAELERLQAILRQAEPGLAEGRLADLLGVAALDATRVEVFDLADLADFGLFNYLIKANGLPEAALEPDRARIEALQGVVLVLYPGAFRQPVTLKPGPTLQPVGAWDEELPDLEFTPLRTESAKGRVGSAASEPVPSPPLPRVLWWGIGLLLLLGLIAVLAVLKGAG